MLSATENQGRRGHRWFAAGVILLMILGVIFGLKSMLSVTVPAWGSSAWLDGTFNREVDRAISLPHQRTLQDLDRAWRYRLLGELGPQVYEGCPGWLFYADGLRQTPDADRIFANNLALTQQYVQTLRNAGIALLVVTVPDKSRVERDALCGLVRAPGHDARLARWEAELGKLGVPLVELSSALQAGAPAFYRTDVHMSQWGAELAARAVSDRASSILTGPGTQRYEVSTEGGPRPRPGDLLTLAGLDGVADGWRPAPDEETLQHVRPVASGGLLDEAPPVEILLAGSSNSRRSNFAERIGADLARPIWNLSRDGGKFSDALVDALSKRTQWPASVRLVIWEMSEMALSQPGAQATEK